MEYIVEVVITSIILVLILFIVGYFMRKKLYKEIDRLESRKLELMNRPVMEEMTKVKKLNMTGQTEEMFERWRGMWDEIIAVQLPNIDEMLFYAEEYSDKYRFNKAKETHLNIEKMLEDIEAQITQILDELEELTGSEEKNREEIEGLLEQYRNSKKNVLAHRHIYGVAAEKFEQLLDAVGEKIANYEELTNNGDYLDARKVVITLASELEQLIIKMEKVPDLLTECQTVIPSQKSELKDGFQEMMQQGFILEHLDIENQFEQIDKALETYIGFLKATETEEVENGLEEIKEKIDTLYDLLEKEVYAKHHILQENEVVDTTLQQLRDINNNITHETKIVQHSYQLLNDDLEAPSKLEKNLSQLSNRYELLKARIIEEKTAFTLLSEELKEIDEQVKALQQEQNDFIEKLQNLRKDELEVRSNIEILQKKIKEIISLVKKSRMPGLPGDFQSLYEQAEEQIGDVIKSLDEKPLNIKAVQKFLFDATDTVEYLYTRTEEHIENARLAEQVIQYGNRYRGRNPQLRANLEKAEQAFRNYEYKSALEQAATAVEEIEPGALKRIEEIFKEEELVKQ
ncbi:septation ring formation regulator EzrA [Lederbergia wuyishanensis]|uniref:Septation ring formation regulator EzrA n=1 Tax=Lederbergia wuyishanensis TaxID=1347903 RepID=A0ABU0D522_9BACI|nr:septation ring formation regulator EzrA [Lederbergia wuyishanensis]MCJ8009600.1 septation ring formation regulator EzrA [Lederbergia wuyishanensis]MDQ0343507.1 septation ring formation regulator [Lederbergia wuyishanensis]